LVFVEKKYSDPQDRIADLLIIQEDLTKRFGNPVSEDFRWVKNTDKNWPDNWGWAVYRSELFITNRWQNEKTDVTAYLGAPKLFYPNLSVTYESREIKSLINEAREQKLLEAP